MIRICRRIPVVAALAVLGATPALASAASPSHYILKSPKAHCRSGYSKKTVTITVKRHHHKIKKHQVRCVRKGSSGGSGVTFPAGLPTVTVTPTIVPTTTSHTYATTAGHTLSVGAPGVLTGASGHGLTAQLVSGPASGTLTLGKDGGFTYAPVAGASGIVHFTYRASGLNNTTSTAATVTIDVSPVAQGGVYDVNSSQTLFIPTSQLLAADVGSGLGATLVGSPADGSLTLDSSGATYNPNGGFAGTDAFTYQAVDSSGLHSNTVTVTINVGSGPPNIAPQTFSGVVGNTPLVVGGSRGSGPVVYQPSGSLLAGDSDPNGGTLSVVPGTQATAHGSVTIAADGSFRYTPTVGVDSGSDAFDYQVDTSEGTSATTSATIDFSGARVWYVDNSFSGTSDGSAGTPFKTLTAAASAASSADQIFVFTGSGAYNPGIVLPAGVSLTGEGADLSAAGTTLLVHGSAPTITNTVGPGVTVGEGSRIAGVVVSANAGAGVTATNINNFTVDSSVSITASTGGHDALDINGGNGTIEVDAQITASGPAGHSVTVSGRTGGTVTIAGAVTDDATGIAINNQSAATVDLTGEITASTTTHTAFAATGGSVAVTNPASTLATTTGTALDVTSPATIGAAGLNFTSISVSNAGTGPLNGIVLSGTGTTGGGLLVTGVPNGGTGVPGSGGTIDNTTGAGVSLSGSGNVVLNDMVISGSVGAGISASNVPTLNVTGTQIVHAGAAGIADGGDGSVAEQSFIINADTISGQPGAALALNGFQGDAQGAIENSTIGLVAAGSGSSLGDGIDLADTSGQFVVEAQGNTIQQVALGVGINVNESTAAEVDLTLNNANNIHLAGVGSGDGVAIHGGAGVTCLNAEDDTINAAGTGLNIYAMLLAAGAGTFNIQGLGATTTTTAVENYLESGTSPVNTLSGTTGQAHATGSSYASPAGTCPTPTGLGITS
jgi:hypothetical protein